MDVIGNVNIGMPVSSFLQICMSPPKGKCKYYFFNSYLSLYFISISMVYREKGTHNGENHCDNYYLVLSFI